MTDKWRTWSLGEARAADEPYIMLSKMFTVCSFPSPSQQTTYKFQEYLHELNYDNYNMAWLNGWYGRNYLC